MYIGFLKASTGVTVDVGPFVDATDGSTLETGLTLSATVQKNGATASASGISFSGGLSGTNGMYSMTLSTSQTDTEGRLTVLCQGSGARPIAIRAQVVNANVYDSLFAAADTDYLQVDAAQLGGADAIASIGYAKDDLDSDRVWIWTQATNSSRSPHTVFVNEGFDGSLKFDLTNRLNKGAGVNTITSVACSPSSGITISNTAKTSDNQGVIFDATGFTSGQTYVFTCTVATTDSDTALVSTGLLTAE